MTGPSAPAAAPPGPGPAPSGPAAPTPKPGAHSPAALAAALGLPAPTAEQAAVIAAPAGPLVVVAGAGAGKTETMAARVVWLVANGHATPEQVLGLTFTRKAAGQLQRRIRTRLARLAGVGLSPAGTAAGPPTVSTYHAFAGSLLREFGLLLPVEPSARLIGETERWQLAYRAVCEYPGPLTTDKTPAAVTDLVLRLAGQLTEHLVDTAALRDTHGELERLVHLLPAGPGQRDTGPTQKLLKLLATQTDRAALIPLVDAFADRMRAANVVDFGTQMSAAARLAATHPDVGEQVRARYRVVLLDEYQDTGHAQRVALAALFGGGADAGLALTAVGDPIQSIYGWRGASATNLPRFTTDFPCADGTPAPTLELTTSWRNPAGTLRLANAVSAQARRRSVAVGELRPRPDAPAGRIECALLTDVAAERTWLADRLTEIHRTAGEAPPTAAVLLRRNADAAPIAAALAARGVPVEVVGVAGLLSVPEVAEVHAMLALVADPTAGTAAVRVLTGPRWRLGAADLAALWRRATELVRTAGEPVGPDAQLADILAAAAPDADSACLSDAVADPGPPHRFSAAGYDRVLALGRELTGLRRRLHHGLPELVAEVRRTVGADVEAHAAQPFGDRSADLGATAHLDRFADVVADYAAHGGHDALGFLAYLDAAAERENGLAPADLAPAPGRVQILTVHAAKGLEWQVVAVPHLSGRIFPSTAAQRTWLSDPGELPPLLRGDRATGTQYGVPVLDLSGVGDRRALAAVVDGHKNTLARRRADEERRLLYVALTRSEHTLLVSGHHWGATEATPRGPSEFLIEVRDVLVAAQQAGTPCGVVDTWAPEPPAGEGNPLRDGAVEASWPVDPVRATRSERDQGALLVSAALADLSTGAPEPPADPADGPPGASDTASDPWAADVDALLAERARALTPAPAVLPAQLSVSALVDLGRDPAGALRRLTVRTPARPDPEATLGTAFHEWVVRFYRAERLFDLDDLPGAVDGDLAHADAARLAALQAAFTASPWAARTPVEVEVPFDMLLEGTVVRGRIDAVFADPDGGFTVLDWKTGNAPTDADTLRHNAVQLAAYRVAWSRISDVEVGAVRAAFHYVRAGRTFTPADLPGTTELAALLRAARDTPRDGPGAPS